MAIRLVRYLWSGDNAKQDGGRKKFFALVQSIYKYHSRRGSPSFKNLTRTSHFSSERRGIRIFRENSGRAFSETRDRAYVCSTLVLVEIEFKTWRSFSRLYHLRNPLTSNVVFRSTVTRRRNAYIYKSTDRDRGSVASMRVANDISSSLGFEDYVLFIDFICKSEIGTIRYRRDIEDQAVSE